jgi:hypothetical protein
MSISKQGEEIEVITEVPKAQDKEEEIQVFIDVAEPEDKDIQAAQAIVEVVNTQHEEDDNLIRRVSGRSLRMEWRNNKKKNVKKEE